MNNIHPFGMVPTTAAATRIIPITLKWTRNISNIKRIWMISGWGFPDGLPTLGSKDSKSRSPEQQASILNATPHSCLSVMGNRLQRTCVQISDMQYCFHYLLFLTHCTKSIRHSSIVLHCCIWIHHDTDFIINNENIYNTCTNCTMETRTCL